MNRKQRRAARNHGQPGRPVIRSQTHELFASALQNEKAGRAAEAARLYECILNVEPRHVESLQNLGAIAIDAGRADIAIDLLGRALVVQPSSADLHFNLAIALRQSGRPAEVVANCRRALAIKPDHAAAHSLLAEMLLLQGDAAEAMASCRRVLASVPNHVDCLTTLAIALVEEGDFEQARHHFERALALQPGNARAQYACGNLHFQQGDMARAADCYLEAMKTRPDDAPVHGRFYTALKALSEFDALAACYETFLAARPGFVPGYNYLALAHLSKGDVVQALDVVRRGFGIDETKHGKAIIAQCLRLVPVAADGELRSLVVRALTEPWMRPMLLAPQCVAMIRANEAIVACIARAVAAWPASPPTEQLFGGSGLRAMAHDEVLRAYLENSRVVTLDIEQLLTAVRRTLLEAAMAARLDTEPDEHTLAFYCALARQCFITEYAFLHSDEDMSRVERLRQALDDALRADAPVLPIQLAALASYMPLRLLSEAGRLLARAWPQPIEALLTQQVREPAEERRLRETIPALTPIEDHVSVAVRSQYEDNPYPRWVAAPTLDSPAPVNGRLRATFPQAEFSPLRTEGTVELLIAGCGTGQTVVDYANRFAGTRTLAIDLSLTSIAYAKRKVEALGLRHVEFAQADILKLGSLGRMFDVINCSGVLHHLGEPEAGWRVLLSLLKPNGFMCVGLYSEIARVHYVAAQKWIAEKGYGGSPDEIRRFRRDFIAAEASVMRAAVLDCSDFYSLSECRDLLFHVQEHRITIPALKALLGRLDLRFIGFDVEDPVRQDYARRFPDDVAQTDLDCWHVFEQENPRTFIGMYQFWVQKAGGAG
jgi:tetratricopeptide (TPR) repeat protein/SAM-dependent methyltransferase